MDSYLGLPTALPSVNYKHLYIVNRLVTRRMRNEPPSVISDSSPMPHKAPSPSIVKARVLDAVSSMLDGGLPGHTEAIYSLELFRQRMTIHSLTPLRRRPHQPATSWAPPEDATEELTFSGRDWLLSGSRDRTLRLWQLSTVEPRVAKVFHSGHEGSILSHYIARIPMGVSEGKPGSPSRSPKLATLSTNKVVAVSGGSDGRICLWAVEDGVETPVKVSQVYSDPVLCVKGDDKRIVSCSKGESHERQSRGSADTYRPDYPSAGHTDVRAASDDRPGRTARRRRQRCQSFARLHVSPLTYRPNVQLMAEVSPPMGIVAFAYGRCMTARCSPRLKRPLEA